MTKLSIVLLVVVIAVALGWYLLTHSSSPPVDGGGQARAIDQAADAVKAARAEQDATTWRQEVAAQRFETIFIDLWDRLRASPDARDILATVPLQSIVLGKPATATKIEHNIELITLEPDRTLSSTQWNTFVREIHGQGYRLEQSEWHHSRFEAAATNLRSTPRKGPGREPPLLNLFGRLILQMCLEDQVHKGVSCDPS